MFHGKCQEMNGDKACGWEWGVECVDQSIGFQPLSELVHLPKMYVCVNHISADLLILTVPLLNHLHPFQ